MEPSAASLELEQLLNPISVDNPCGDSLRWDAVWTELTELRKTRKDPLDPSKDKLPDWAKVLETTTDLLAGKSKDLMLAGWLTEAAMRLKGFPGLRDGLRLIQGLVERYWDKIHPQIEDQDFSNRAAPLIWLASDDSGARLSVAMREIPLAPPSQGQVLNWRFWHLRRVSNRAPDEKEDVYKKRCAEAEKNKQTFDGAVESAPIAFYQTMAADMQECLAAIESLSALLDQQLKDLSPNFNGMRSAIVEIQVFVNDTLKRRGGLPAPDEPKDSESVEQQTLNQNSAIKGGPIRSRADAISRLGEVATFFSETEPHSPVAFLVRRAIRWSGMPFNEVLAELVKDDKLVKQIGETLGIVQDGK